MKILGISGRKQAGKNTVANFIIGLEMSSLGLIRGEWFINSQGQLEISDILGDTRFSGVFDINRNNPSMEAFRQEYTNDLFKVYSFADLLKQSVCIDVFGLSYEQCYGTDADKKTYTKLKWENMPGVLTTIPVGDNIMTIPVSGHLGVYYNRVISYGSDGTPYNEATPIGIHHEPGYMTAREVMQYIGTDVFRRMHEDVWPEALMSKIKKDNSAYAIITDLRFANEVRAVSENNGKVMRLTRDPFKDNHSSECILDKENYDWKNFHIIIDNATMTIPQQNAAVYAELSQIGWAPEIREI